MRKMVEEAKRRLACRSVIYKDTIVLIPHVIQYDVRFEIRKYRDWFILSEYDRCWYLLCESKSRQEIIDRIIKEHGGLAL